MAGPNGEANGEWAILELMGHRQRIGYVSEVERYGGKLLRIDLPFQDGSAGSVTEFYGATSIYSLRPVSEQIARDMAKRLSDPRPVQPMEYRLEHRSEAADDIAAIDDMGTDGF